FDDPLAGFDTRFYIPCLRTDDLVFHLTKPEVRQRLAKATEIEPGTPATLREAVGNLFTHFVGRGARACAISLPPDFQPQSIEASAVEPVLRLVAAGRPISADESRTLSRFVFWMLAEFCVEHRLPFDLMIGVNRR